MSEPRQASIVLGLLVPLFIGTGVLFPSGAGPMVLFAGIFVVILVRDTRTVRADGAIVANSSNFITRTIEDYLVRQHERHYGPGTARISRFRAPKHKPVPLPDGLRIVVYTTVLTTVYFATHMAVTGSIDVTVHRLVLPVLTPANAVNTHGFMEGTVWGVVIGGPIALALGINLAGAARSGPYPKPAWPELRLPVFLILISAG